MKKIVGKLLVEEMINPYYLDDHIMERLSRYLLFRTDILQIEVFDCGPLLCLRNELRSLIISWTDQVLVCAYHDE